MAELRRPATAGCRERARARIAEAFAAARERRPGGADALHDGRLPGPGGAAAGRRAYADAGADLIELGIPFSGPARRRPGDPRRGDGGAGGRNHDAGSAGGLREGRGPRPGGVMTYANTILGGGRGGVRPQLAEAGAAGAIVPTCRWRRPRSSRRARGRLALVRPDRAHHPAGAAPGDLRADAGGRFRLRRRHRRGHRRAQRAAARAERPGRGREGGGGRRGAHRSRSASASAPRAGRRRRRGCGRGDHRQPPRADGRRGAARAGAGGDRLLPARHAPRWGRGLRWARRPRSAPSGSLGARGRRGQRARARRRCASRRWTSCSAPRSRFKAESLQQTGSFKARGVSVKLAALGEECETGVVAGTAGNHGRALAWAARRRGVPCEPSCPRTRRSPRPGPPRAWGRTWSAARGPSTTASRGPRSAPRRPASPSSTPSTTSGRGRRPGQRRA